MHYRIEAKKFTPEQQFQLSQSLDQELKDTLNTQKAYQANIDTGDVVTMYDGEDLQMVTVIETMHHQVTVYDHQGFIHICERWSYCDSSNTVIVKAITGIQHKKALGYDAKYKPKCPKVHRHNCICDLN